MKISELILKMSNDTEILIYESYERCSMPYFGDCEGGKNDEYDCRDCTYYLPENSESALFHGRAGECPIKIADMDVQEINNAKHMIQAKSKRKFVESHMIAIRVNR